MYRQSIGIRIIDQSKGEIQLKTKYLPNHCPHVPPIDLQLQDTSSGDLCSATIEEEEEGACSSLSVQESVYYC